MKRLVPFLTAAQTIAEGGGRVRARAIALALLLAGILALAVAPPNAHSNSHQATVLSDATAVVASGGWHDTCAVVVGGTVRCWGDNNKAGLGDNTQVPFATAPVEVCASGSWVVAANGCLDGQTVSTLTDVASVAVGGDHACALSTAGGVKCWGLASLGQLGDGIACLG